MFCAIPAQCEQLSILYSIAGNGQQIQPDSIRVYVPLERIDTVITASGLVLPAAPEPGLTEVSTALYDMQGRLLDRRMSSLIAPRLRYDREYGVVLEAPDDPAVLRVIADRVVKVVVWKDGYEITESQFTLNGKDTTVQIVATMLPWWKRIRYIDVKVAVPVCEYTKTSDNGAPPDTMIVRMNVGIRRMMDSDYDWRLVGNVLSYKKNVNQKVYDLLEDSCAITIDTVNGTITSMYYHFHDYHGSPLSRFVQFSLNAIDHWGSVATNIQRVRLVDAAAQRCLRTAYQHDHWFEANTHDHVEYDAVYAPILPLLPGVTIDCAVYLVD